MSAFAAQLDASPALRLLLRVRWILLGSLALGLALASTGDLHGQSDWQFFTWGGNLVVGHHAAFHRADVSFDGRLPGGLHTYASYPFLQIGPPALLLGILLDVTPGHGLVLAGLVVAALGLGFVVASDAAFPGQRMVLRRLGWAAGAALTLATWSAITHFRHLDDAITLTATAACALAVSRNRALLAGVVAGLAASAKPWGAPVVVVLLALPGAGARRRAAASAIAVVALCWAPFVVADRGTLSVGAVRLFLSPDSVPAVLGVHAIGVGTPIRLVELIGGTAVGLLAVRRGAWWAAPLAAFALRLAIDPSAYHYYAPALVAAAYLAERGAVKPLPLTTVIAATSVMVLQRLDGHPAGFLRLVLCAWLLAVALGAGRWLAAPVTSAAPSGLPARPTRGLPAGA